MNRLTTIGTPMGRQLNFWMAEEDEREFVERLLKDDAVWSPRAIPLGGEPRIHEFSEWQPDAPAEKLIVMRRENWPDLCHKHIAESPLDLPKFTPWTMVGCDSSPCFEWNTCERTPSVIRRGRVYLHTTWLSEGLTYHKSDELLRWFNRIVDWLKRRGVKAHSSTHRVMPHANHLATEHAIALTS